jgi:hypothetical protein
LLATGVYTIKYNLWTKLPNAKVYRNGELDPDAEVYTKDQNYWVNGYFIYPKEKRLGFTNNYRKIFGYIYTPDNYRGDMALSGTAKWYANVKFENKRVVMLLDGRKDSVLSMTVCPNERE